MIPTSAKELVRFTPPDIAPDTENAPVYLIAVPTLMQRAAYRRDMVATGARYVVDTRLLELLRDGIKAVVEDRAQPELLELVDSYEAATKTATVETPIEATLAEDFAELEITISKYYSPYAEACSARSYWLSVAPILACRHFLRGWENVAPEYKQRAGLVSEELLEQLPDAHVTAIGYQALALMSPTRADAKN